MISGGRRPSALVPVPWRSVTRTTWPAASAAPAARSSGSSSAATASAVTNGRSMGSTRMASAPPAIDVGSCLGEAGVEAAWSAGGGSGRRSRLRLVRTSGSGLIDQDVVEPGDGQGALDGPCQEILDEVMPLLGIERVREPGLGALERADRDDRGDPHRARAGGRAASRRRRELEDVAREAGTAGVVAHDGVDHERPDPERGDLGLEVGVDRVEHEGRGEAPVHPGHSPGARFVAERRQHPIGRALESHATDDGTDRHDRDAGERPFRDEIADRPREDRPDRDDRVRRPDDDHIGRWRVASTTASVGRFSPPNRTSRTSGPLAPMDEVLLEVDPALVDADLGPDRLVGHRQDPGRDAERAPGATAPPRSASGPRGSGASARCASRNPGRRGGTSPPRRTRPVPPSRSRSRRSGPSHARRRNGPTACTTGRRDRA